MATLNGHERISALFEVREFIDGRPQVSAKLGSSPILVGSFENAVDSVSFWDERINHRTLSRITGS
jgi:hypothetical protein